MKTINSKYCEIIRGDDVKLVDRIKSLAQELDDFYSKNFSKNINSACRFQSMDSISSIMASTGGNVHFSHKARGFVHGIAKTIYENNDGQQIPLSKIIEFNEFEANVQQVAADFYAEGRFQEMSEITVSEIKQAFVAKINLKTNQQFQEFTHYFPAWTLGMENIAPYSIGPVVFLTQDQWIESVDIPDWGEENYHWKELLRGALANPNEAAKLKDFAKDIYGPISKYPSVLKIKLRGFEQALSRKLAEMICRSALDATSLILGECDFFHQQALASERLEPARTYSFIETDGKLWMPSSVLSPCVRTVSPDIVSAKLERCSPILNAIGYTLNSLADESLHKHPKLASRWSMALHWYAEGNREKNDAIALAKIATSLDVLSGCGKSSGIIEMLGNLFKISPDDEVITVSPDDQEITGRSSQTLKQFVEKIYVDGRSKILHGSHPDRLKTYSEQRVHAACYARQALIESVRRLQSYSGKNDDDKTFRTLGLSHPENTCT